MHVSSQLPRGPPRTDAARSRAASATENHMVVDNPTYCAVKNCFSTPVEDGLCDGHLEERDVETYV